MPRTSHKKPYPIDRYLQRVRDFYAKHGRIPRSDECEKGQSTNKHLIKHYGSWDAVIKHALGQPSNYQPRNDESFKDLFVGRFNEKGKLLTIKDFSRAEYRAIQKYFGSITAASEKYLLNSNRLEIMRIVNRLMPSGCDAPTTQEIYGAAMQSGLELSIYEVRGYLDHCVRQNLMSSGRYDQTVWWKLTPAGIQFMNQFRGGKNGNRSR
jgi:hypothetical protein